MLNHEESLRHRRYPNSNRRYKARINCYMNNVLQAWIFFQEKNIERPQINQDNIFQMYFPYGDFDTVVSILRNERPIFLSIWGDFRKPKDMYCEISTNPEPAGEEEGQ